MYTSANTYYLQILVCWKIFESLLQNLWFYKWFNLRKLFTFGPFLKEKCQITILNFSIFEEKKLSDTNLEKKLRNDQTEKLSKIKLSLQYHQDCQMSQAKVNFKLLQSRTTDAQRGNSLHCTARPKIHSHSKMFRYGRSIFCLPDQPNFSDIFDLCLRWVSVVRGPDFLSGPALMLAEVKKPSCRSQFSDRKRRVIWDKKRGGSGSQNNNSYSEVPFLCCKLRYVVFFRGSSNTAFYWP